MGSGPDGYDELYVYAMGRDPAAFVLQHAVDAHAAQTATVQMKPIALIFALVGLYLRVEKGLSGKQVQQVHMRLGRRKRNWPAVRLPHERGAMTAEDVLAVPAGAERDDAIDAWCKSVWEAFAESRETIVELLREHQIT
jgi:hypothetical protein